MSEPNNGGPAMADPFEAIRAHVEKNASKERATFTIAGVEALLAAVDAALSAAAQPAPGVKELDDLIARVKKATDFFRTTSHHTTTKLLNDILEQVLFPLASRPTPQAGASLTEPVAWLRPQRGMLAEIAIAGAKKPDNSDYWIPLYAVGQAPRNLHGPFGWLNGRRDLSEDSWELENDPQEKNEEYFSIPLYALVDPFQESGKATPPSPSQGTVERAEPVDELGSRIKKVMEEEDHNGASCGWRSCTGCHETNEGAETGHYPYSKAFGCYVGAGCGECGGLGVVWEYWSKDALDEMARDLSEEPAAPPDGDAAKALRVLELSEAEIADVIAPYFTEGYSAYDAAQAVIRLAKRRGERP